MDRLARVRHLLLWSTAAVLGVLTVYGAIASRSVTGGGAPFFLIAAAIAAPPLHVFWKRNVTLHRYIVIVPLSVIGLGFLLGASWEQADQQARAAGWRSADDQRRALSAGFTTPDRWAPYRRALDEEEARLGAARAETARQTRAAEAEAKRRKEAECRVTLSCWAEKTTITASLRCREPVERLPRFSFRWTDKWYEPKFSHYRWASKDKGTVTYIGDRIEIQNVFGAWQPHIYECDFDPVAKQVIAVRTYPGRL